MNRCHRCQSPQDFEAPWCSLCGAPLVVTPTSRAARLPCHFFAPRALSELYEERREALATGVLRATPDQVAITIRLLTMTPSSEQLHEWLVSSEPAGLWLWLMRPAPLPVNSSRLRLFVGDAGLNRLAAQLWEIEAFQRPMTRWGEQVEQLGVLLLLQRLCARLEKSPLEESDLSLTLPYLNTLGERLTLTRLSELARSGLTLIEEPNKQSLLLRICQRATQLCQNAFSQALLEQHRQRLVISRLRVVAVFEEGKELDQLLGRCEASGVEVFCVRDLNVLRGLSWDPFDLCLVSESFYGLDGIELALSLGAPLPITLIVRERSPFTMLRASHAGLAGVASLNGPLADFLNELTLSAKSVAFDQQLPVSSDADPLLMPLTRSLQAATTRGEALGMLLMICDPSQQDILLLTCREEMGPLVECCPSDHNEVALFWPGVDESEVRNFISLLRERFSDLVSAGLFCVGQRAPGPLLRELRQRLRWSVTAGEHLVMGWWRARESGAMASSESQRILIVDQDEDTRELIRFACERLGFSVATLGSGAEALELIEGGELPLQLLIAEVSLPKVSGLELLRAVRQRAAHQVSVLLLSLNSDQIWIEEAFQFGANDFLYKPFNLAELLARIQHVLAQHKLANRTPTPTPIEAKRLIETKSQINEQRLLEQLHSPLPLP